MRIYWLWFFLCFVLLDASSGLAKELNKRRTPLVVAAEKVSPAVVNIYTSETGRSPRNPFRDFGNNTIGISIDETTTESHIDEILSIFGADKINVAISTIPIDLVRASSYLNHPVFNSYQSETEMLRYLHRLESKDISLNTSMIPLGSCTMKLNATTEMEAITWPEFGNIHPFAPNSQTAGYRKIIAELGSWLVDITGFDDISMQPNSGAQGEYTGLLLIRAFHIKNGNNHRNICLIPSSAHGTNPASAVMAGMKVIIIQNSVCKEM